MAFACISSIQNYSLNNKLILSTPINQELINNGLFNAYTMALPSSLSYQNLTASVNFPYWTISWISSGLGGLILYNNATDNTSIGLTQSTSSASLSSYFVAVQHYNTNTTNTFTQVIKNMAVGSYTFSMYLQPKNTYYNSSQTVTVTIGGNSTSIIPNTSFVTGTTTTGWTKYTGTFTLNTSASRALRINFLSTSTNTDSTIFMSTISVVRNS
jgi:hypothetical protein